MALLEPRFKVIAVDEYGSGKSPDWTAQQRLTLDDELALLEPILAAVNKPMHVVGHSYGAAVALKFAARWPQRVRSLALYEPTFFSLVLRTPGSETRVQGIVDAVDASVARHAAGDAENAAEPFIDYWMGAGAWAAMPEERKPGVRRAVTLIGHWSHALCNDPLGPADLARLTMPVLYLAGERSPPAAHAVTAVLRPMLPDVTYRELARRGHMAPVTHADEVNAIIADFLRD